MSKEWRKSATKLTPQMKVNRCRMALKEIIQYFDNRQMLTEDEESLYNYCKRQYFLTAGG
jgi:hypothetical protein